MKSWAHDAQKLVDDGQSALDSIKVAVDATKKSDHLAEVRKQKKKAEVWMTWAENNLLLKNLWRMVINVANTIATLTRGVRGESSREDSGGALLAA